MKLSLVVTNYNSIIFFSSPIAQMTIQLKNIIIADCRTCSYFFLHLLLYCGLYKSHCGSITRNAFKKKNCIAGCTIPNVFIIFFCIAVCTTPKPFKKECVVTLIPPNHVLKSLFCWLLILIPSFNPIFNQEFYIH